MNAIEPINARINNWVVFSPEDVGDAGDIVEQVEDSSFSLLIFLLVCFKELKLFEFGPSEMLFFDMLVNYDDDEVFRVARY